MRSWPFRVCRVARTSLAVGTPGICGMATRLAFEAWAGVSTQALQALEFSRYCYAYAPADALLVAISNSGRVSRTVEAVMRARKRGMKTVAGTSALDSPVATEADVALDLAYSERRFAPGTSSYKASMVLQYCIALHLARVAGRMSTSQVQQKLDEIAGQAEPMQKTLDAAKPVLDSLGTEAQISDKIVFIGGGPNYGTAFFSMAKLFEAARVNAVGQELEEWAHEQYFVTDRNTYTFVLAPPGNSLDRAREQLLAANAMGSTTVAVCDRNDAETAALAKVIVPVVGTADELLSPLTYCLAGELFAFYFAVSKNLTMLGFDDPRVKEVNFQQIFHSRIASI